MMRILVACVALLVATPAAAQTGQLPAWLTGYWCTEPVDKVSICIRYEAPADGRMRATNIVVDDGTPETGRSTVMAIEGGVIVKRTSEGRITQREVSHRPNDLLLEAVNPVENQARQVRYTLSGDTLTLEFILDGAPSETQHYLRMPEN